MKSIFPIFQNEEFLRQKFQSLRFERFKLEITKFRNYFLIIEYDINESNF